MPVTTKEYEQSLSAAPLCEQLRIRDLLDNVAIQVDGSFVAGYELSGLNSYYASDEGRNRTKSALEALVRSLSERSMRIQVRHEISEGAGDLIARYNHEQHNNSAVPPDARPEAHRGVAPEGGGRLLPSAPSTRLLHLESPHPPPVSRL